MAKIHLMDDGRLEISFVPLQIFFAHLLCIENMDHRLAVVDPLGERRGQIGTELVFQALLRAVWDRIGDFRRGGRRGDRRPVRKGDRIERRHPMKTKQKAAFLCGILGCLCYGGGDWLMMYADPSHPGAVSWLTDGTAVIPQWRYDLAMALAFPGIILYGIALFSLQSYIKNEKGRKIYHYLNAFGLTPWIALHLFYIMILTLYSWMNGNGYAAQALPVCEGLFSQLSWIVPVTEGMMLPVFVYWSYLQIRGRTVFPKWMAWTNVLLILGALRCGTLLMPDSAFRLGATNGLMSESMVIWFAIMMIHLDRRRKEG